MTKIKPDLSNLRTFGCRIFARKPGKRRAKLDNNSTNGIFLGYTSSNKNVYYLDDKTSNVKMGTHALFDKAHFTVPKDKVPLLAQTLQILGYHKPNDIFTNGDFPSWKNIKSTWIKQPYRPNLITTWGL